MLIGHLCIFFGEMSSYISSNTNWLFLQGEITGDFNLLCKDRILKVSLVYLHYFQNKKNTLMLLSKKKNIGWILAIAFAARALIWEQHCSAQYLLRCQVVWIWCHFKKWLTSTNLTEDWIPAIHMYVSYWDINHYALVILLLIKILQEIKAERNFFQK